MIPIIMSRIVGPDDDLDPDELAEYLAYLDAVNEARADFFGADDIVPFAVDEDAVA